MTRVAIVGNAGDGKSALALERYPFSFTHIRRV
jgi:hypothetical protein